MRRATATVLAVSALALAACGSSGGGSTGGPGTSPGGLSGDITVLAAASLTESFTEIGQLFEAANPGTKVTFSFGASSALAEQINSGSPADVFASASQSTMDQVVEAGNAADPKTFAQNQMEIATPPENPGDVKDVSSLADPAVKVALCQPEVPCGKVAAQVFTNAGIRVTPVTLEPDVKSVLSKVTLKEVDAGVVYVTDVLAARDDVLGIEIPADVNASTSYPIATLTNAPNQALAAAFMEFVLSDAGMNVLAEAGFAAP
jgi:molybdate transport system substrate-binding protein